MLNDNEQSARQLALLSSRLIDALPKQEFTGSAKTDEPWTWPQAQFLSYVRALQDLQNGILDGLAEFIRFGLPIDRTISEEILKLIDGSSQYASLKIVKKKGKNSPYSARKVHRNKIRIALIAKSKLEKSSKGQYESIIMETATKMGVSRSTVNDAIAYLNATPPGWDWIEDINDILQELPSE